MYAEERVKLPKIERRTAARTEAGPRHGIQHILVCLDGSSTSSICIAYAQCLAKTFGSKLTLLHVMEHQDERSGPHTTDALGWELMRQEAGARLKLLQAETAKITGRQVRGRLEQGRPADRIVAMSRELGVDLVVLGCTDQDGRASCELGLTAQQVLAAGRSSVLIARGDSMPPQFAAPKRILVPLDGSMRTEGVLPTAENIARDNGAELLLVHVVAEPMPTSVLVDPDDLQIARDLALRLQSRAALYLEDLRLHMGYDRSLVSTKVDRQVDRRSFLVKYSEDERVDLIVLSAHGRTCNVVRPVGSVTAYLMTYSKVPLLVLQDLPESEFLAQCDLDARHAPPPRGDHVPGNA